MKKLFILLFLLLTVSAKAQKTPENLKLQIWVQQETNIFGQVIRTDSESVVGLPYKQLFQEYHQPLIYAKWWKEIETCTKLYVPITLERKVHFYYVNSEAFYFVENPHLFFVGYTFAATNKIYIASPHIVDPVIVKHEMVHFLMFENGKADGHPDRYYDGRCGIRQHY